MSHKAKTDETEGSAMTIIEFTFPTGRFHATPWGRNVNEGAVEWPVSPWRILRAMLATWHLKAREDVPEATMRQLIEALSRHEPTFCLPWSTSAHTRHYMPLMEGRAMKSTKIFDAFVQTPPSSPVRVSWPVDLLDDQQRALRLLATRLGYLGRTESLAIARVLDHMPDLDEKTHWICTPMVEGELVPDRWEVVRTLCPIPAAEFNAWREQMSARVNAGKRSRKKQPLLPTDLFEALQTVTADLQTAGWNLPPGARFVNYTRPEDVFTPQRLVHHRPRASTMPTMARFAVVSTVAPRILQAMSVADRAHKALCVLSDHSDGAGPAPVFSGIGPDMRPRTDHAHAHILCEANGPRDTITHITIWAPMGFDAHAVEALRRLNKVWGHGGHDVRLVLHAVGQPDDFAECALVGKARVWRSLTPFVSTRHPKTYRDGRPKIDPENGWPIGSPGHDLLRLLAAHMGATGVTVRQLIGRERPFRFGDRRLAALDFQTVRHGGAGRRGRGPGAAFEITFPEPVRGPIALGYGAHFGLGLFAPVR